MYNLKLIHVIYYLNSFFPYIFLIFCRIKSVSCAVTSSYKNLADQIGNNLNLDCLRASKSENI